MIDDLDRCLPSKVVNVLKSLNLFIGDQTNCIFFLAADRDFIEKSIFVQYKNLFESETLKSTFQPKLS